MNYCKSGKISTNKFWELQVTNLFEGPYFNFQVQWTRQCDHAGFQVLIEIHKFMFDFKIFDNRHWDYYKSEYEKHST
jgi:hypothetical protein